MTEKHEKNPERVEKGKENVRLRADFVPEARLTTRGKDARPINGHADKIYKYRDRLFWMLKDTISIEDLDNIDVQSQAELGTNANNTDIALYSDFCQFVSFCISKRICPIPITASAVEEYLKDLAERKRITNGKEVPIKRATIERHFASIIKWAKTLESEDPREDRDVQRRMKKIRMSRSGAQRQAKGFRAADLESALEIFNPEIPRDCLDIAILFVSFETLSRESELIEYDWEDHTVSDDGTSIMHLEKSKTDQDGEGADLFLSKNTTDLLMGWKRMSGQSFGPIFRGIYSDGKLGERLSTKGVGRSFKRVAKRIGLNAALFSGHSARVGATQEMVERHITVAKIMLAGRWKSLTMIARYSRKINAKRNGMADLTNELGWNVQRPGINALDHSVTRSITHDSKVDEET